MDPLVIPSHQTSPYGFYLHLGSQTAAQIRSHHHRVDSPRSAHTPEFPMADSSDVQFLMVPPRIHTEDPGSPPPESILLDRYGYLSSRVNSTTAQGFTADGKSILVTFWVASPPRVSCFTVQCPDVKPSAFGCLPAALYSEDDLVLLRISIIGQDVDLHAECYDYFVYQAGTEKNPPSLEMLPIPRYVEFYDRELLLLRCREQDMFYLAILRRTIDLKYRGKRFDLHLYNSKTGTWNSEAQFVDSVTYWNYKYTNFAVTLGGEFGSVGWVDLWRGMLICDLLRDKHSLRYIPVPLPLVPKPLKGYPSYYRDIVVVGDCIKFIEMSIPVYACTCADQGMVAATKKMKISDIGSGNNWEEDCTFKFSDIPVDSSKFARMLSNLKQVENTKLTLRRLCAGYPALSLHEVDVVYTMHTPDPDVDKALVIALDMRNKTLKGVASFGSGRPLGYAFTYLRSGISKHLNIWPSSRWASESVSWWTNDVLITAQRPPPPPTPSRLGALRSPWTDVWRRGLWGDAVAKALVGVCCSGASA